MEKSTACVDTEAQKKIDTLETEAQQLRSELSELHEEATAAADEKKAERPHYSKMKCGDLRKDGTHSDNFDRRTDRRKST